MNLKNILFLAAASLTIVACSEHDEFEKTNDQTSISSIQSGNTKFSTRFNGLTGKWENGDAIGVYMLDETNTTPVNDGTNVEFVTWEEASTVKFSADPGIEIANQSVNFYAYYPYNADISADFKYSIDLSDQSAGYSSYDLMWAKKTHVTKENLETDGLSLTFEHKLVMLEVNVTSFPEGITSLTEVLASGVNTAAEFNLVSGQLTLGNVIKTLKLYKVDNDTYGAIILPTETPGNIMLTFIADGRKFQYAVPSSIAAFNAGSKYVFNIALGTSGAKGSLTEIEGGNTPWGGEEGNKGTGTEVPNNPNIPADYTSVSVTADNLANILNGYAGKVALIFNTGITYSPVETIAVPETVTELMFIGEGNTQIALSLQEITYTNLQKMVLQNLKITGVKEKNLLFNQPDHEFASDATVEIKNCDFTNMKAVCGWDTREGSKNVLASFIVENCQFTNMESLFNQYRSKYIEVKKSTLYKMSGRAIYPNTYDGVPAPTVIVEACTLVDLVLTPIEANSTNGNMTYKNNISACFNSHKNLAYKMNIVEFSGNYAAADVDLAVQVHNKPVPEDNFPDAWASQAMTREQLFADAANGDFTTTVAAGDPCWRP